MGDYNIGVQGFLAVKGGDRLQALYYCGGDACEREGWCYAQRIQLGWMVAIEAGYCPSQHGNKSGRHAVRAFPGIALFDLLQPHLRAAESSSGQLGGSVWHGI